MNNEYFQIDVKLDLDWLLTLDDGISEPGKTCTRKWKVLRRISSATTPSISQYRLITFQQEQQGHRIINGGYYVLDASCDLVTLVSPKGPVDDVWVWIQATNPSKDQTKLITPLWVIARVSGELIPNSRTLLSSCDLIGDIVQPSSFEEISEMSVSCIKNVSKTVTTEFRKQENFSMAARVQEVENRPSNWEENWNFSEQFNFTFSSDSIAESSKEPSDYQLEKISDRNIVNGRRNCQEDINSLKHGESLKEAENISESGVNQMASNILKENIPENDNVMSYDEQVEFTNLATPQNSNIADNTTKTISKETNYTKKRKLENEYSIFQSAKKNATIDSKSDQPKSNFKSKLCETMLMNPPSSYIRKNDELIEGEKGKKRTFIALPNAGTSRDGASIPLVVDDQLTVHLYPLFVSTAPLTGLYKAMRHHDNESHWIQDPVNTEFSLLTKPLTRHLRKVTQNVVKMKMRPSKDLK